MLSEGEQHSVRRTGNAAHRTFGVLHIVVTTPDPQAFCLGYEVPALQAGEDGNGYR